VRFRYGQEKNRFCQSGPVRLCERAQFALFTPQGHHVCCVRQAHWWRLKHVNSHQLARWMEPAAGGALMFVALLDLFLTVLYARAGAGFVSDQVARGTWVVFRNISKLFGRKRAIVLSLSGSFIVVALVAVWAMMLAVGAALIMHPYLGTSVRSSGGTNSGDFLTALYAGGSSMSMVGASNYSGDTPAFRMVYLLNSLIGMSVMSLALTYVMQIYNALQKRNAFGRTLELMSRSTGDAAVLIGSLGPQGEFSAGYTNVATLAEQMVLILESHDFYPVLFYFRFPEPHYSASRITLLSLDCVSLLRAALSEDSYFMAEECSFGEPAVGVVNLVAEDTCAHVHARERAARVAAAKW
jgi:hypothetical protein